MANRTDQDQHERDARLGLWAIPGLGVAHLAELRARIGGQFSALLDVPVEEWSPLLPPTPMFSLAGVPTLRELAEGVKETAARAGIQYAFEEDEAYPDLLLDLPDPPAVLFYFGAPGVHRRRAAMVGTRRPDGGFHTVAYRIAREVAEAGVGIVSGAAYGIDRICHQAALDAGGETWAFLASGLDELDTAQANTAGRILAGGGRVFTEYPPKVRADKPHFPRRNRLIAGASDATLVVRAPMRSGSLYTAGVARQLGRPLLAIPGELGRDEAAGCNALIHEGYARLCRGSGDVLTAAGVELERAVKPAAPGRSVGDLGLSVAAQKAYGALNRAPRVLEEVLGETGMDPAELSSALCELELQGLLVQHPGKLYEKV